MGVTIFAAKLGELKRIQISIKSTDTVNDKLLKAWNLACKVSAMIREARITRGSPIKLCILDVMNVVLNGAAARKQIVTLYL
jgi:hypothetical protein